MLRLIFLLLLTSCSLFKSSPKAPVELSSIRVLGEGRGRLGVDDHSYIFAIEAFEKKPDSYVLAATIPMHGEEVLTFANLKEPRVRSREMQSFSKQLKGSFNPELIEGMRSLIRLVLAKKLGLEAQCSNVECRLGAEVFAVKKSADRMMIEKILPTGSRVRLEGSNLTDSFFEQTDFRIFPPKSSKVLMSLELFWSST